MLLFLTTYAIAVSMTLTAVYLIYYPMSDKIKKRLETLNIQGIVTMGYFILFSFIGSQWQSKQPLVFYWLFATAINLVASLVLVEYEDIRVYVLWGALGWLILTFVIDVAAWATMPQFDVFYGPALIEAALYGIGCVILYFRVPEIWFKRQRWVWLYASSQVIYHLLLINFLFELQAILYYTIKYNSGALKDPRVWWYIKNVYE